MKLKSDTILIKGQPVTRIFIHGRFRPFSEIVTLPGIEGFTSDMLLHRWKNGDDTEERFLRPKRFKKANSTKPKLPEHIDGLTLEQIDNLREDRPLLIYDQGYHKDKLDGEVLIGFFSMQWISKEVPWDTKRISESPRYKQAVKNPKYALFIMKTEAVEKGFIVV